MDGESIGKRNPKDGASFPAFSLSLLAAYFFFLSACVTSQSVPNRLPPLESSSQERVTVLALNNLHGNIASENNEAEALENLAGTLREEYGNRLLILDAGDHLQGSLESWVTHGRIVTEYLNRLGINAAGLGEQEYSSVFQPRIGEARFPYLGAIKLPNVYGNAVLSAGKIKVGVFSVISPNTAKFIRKSVRVAPLVEAASAQAKSLREKGAQIVVAIVHGAISCRIPGVVPTNQSPCSGNSEVLQMLREVDNASPGLIHAVIAGNEGETIHHWYKGMNGLIPIIQSPENLRAVQLLHFTYDHSSHQVLTDQTTIEGPLSLCCNLKTQKNPGFRSWLSHFKEEIETFAQEQVTESSAELIADPTRESQLLNLIADAIRSDTQSDFGLIHPGLVKKSLPSGQILNKDIYQAIPYHTGVAVLELNGAELKRMLRIAFCGARGVYGFSGGLLKLIPPQASASSTDLNKDGRISYWEINRLIDVTTENGKAILNKKKYKLALPDYLARGGDDFEWLIRQTPDKQVSWKTDHLVRSLFVDFLKKKGAIKPNALSPRITYRRKIGD